MSQDPHAADRYLLLSFFLITSPTPRSNDGVFLQARSSVTRKCMLDSIVVKDVLSAIAFIVTVALFADYIRSVRAAQTVPHVFSWVIWAGGTLIVFVAQLAGGGGVGAWPIGFSGCITGYIAYLAYRKRHQSPIKSLDWVFFALAISALPAWWLASDPLWAVVLLTSADVIGFGPTFRRAYHHPYQEHAGFFPRSALRPPTCCRSLTNIARRGSIRARARSRSAFLGRNPGPTPCGPKSSRLSTCMRSISTDCRR